MQEGEKQQWIYLELKIKVLVPLTVSSGASETGAVGCGGHGRAVTWANGSPHGLHQSVKPLEVSQLEGWCLYTPQPTSANTSLQYNTIIQHWIQRLFCFSVFSSLRIYWMWGCQRWRDICSKGTFVCKFPCKQAFLSAGMLTNRTVLVPSELNSAAL